MVPTGRFHKRLQKIKDGPRSVSRKDLVWLLKHIGFEEAGGKGSHESYKYSGRRGFFLTIPDQDPLHVKYVKEAVWYIDEILEEEG